MSTHHRIQRWAIAALVLATSAGCSFGGTEAESPALVPPSQQPPEVDQVVEILTPLAESKPFPSTGELFDVLLEGGYEPEQLEATLDESPLGNEVPSKVFGIRTDDGCIVGEIRQSAISAELFQASESTGTCLFGEVERPEGAPDPEGEERSEDDTDNGTGHIPGESINGETPPEEPEEPEAPDDSGNGSDGGSGLGGN